MKRLFATIRMILAKRSSHKQEQKVEEMLRVEALAFGKKYGKVMETLAKE